MDKSLYSADYLRFCDVLRRLRIERGLTQVDVAERLDKPQSFVSKYETGERRLDVAETHSIAAALGTTLEAIAAEMHW
ncbi:helix-turn-helix domain-containing protein [Nocardia aurea]|uniref:helix-turn-helix domain-containing protein n=1 Tax=Nocardia aurea TaxID=2144174 RepID=UPI000D68E266|nr:helix-turn-helix transcriptional regulator [Nocardia aurea]